MNLSVLPILDKERELPVMERFHTLQGEGHNVGQAAFFIRMAGCNVGCTWCDVKESWRVQPNQMVDLDALVEEVKITKSSAAVVTGGEPCMYDLFPLTDKLNKFEIKTWLETSGAYEITGKWNWIVVSPKKFKKPLQSSLKKANELKIIVCTKHDFRWAEEHANQVSKECKLYLQPEWERRKQVQSLIIDYIKKNPKWHLSQQTHKYLGIP